MQTIILVRDEESKEHGTFGKLFVNGREFCHTLEPADRDNKKNISSIPCGVYQCKPYSSKKYPDVFQICNVPDRTNILFHSGNTDDDTAGCVLLGSTRGKLGNDRAILNSGNTFRKFRLLMGKMVFRLIVCECYD
jgi:hypothetical protein